MVEQDFDLTGAREVGRRHHLGAAGLERAVGGSPRAGGVLGTIDRASGTVKSVTLRERSANSFAVDETGGVYVVTDPALYRFDAGTSGSGVTWRQAYENSGIKKPGQLAAGLRNDADADRPRPVSITDNADR